jgi:methionyl-tRNA formyltransferase
MTSALVFAYHDVGVRCLQILLAHGVKVGLVVTHEDATSENIWFGSVAELARSHDIPVVTPDDPNTSDLAFAAAQMNPDFIFSFYYRHMLKKPLIETARFGALNMHGSLLPKYRGRAPVNWAIVRGEVETGATLHYMEVRPDAGDIVDQQAVTILPDDNAVDVFGKVTSAAAAVLDRSLDKLVAGNAPRIVQDQTQATYFGRRTPEDGRIDWTHSAAQIHNLVRGVAPPYPGAFSDVAGEVIRIFRTTRIPFESGPYPGPFLFFRDGACLAQCGDGQLLQIEIAQWRGQILEGRKLTKLFAGKPVPLHAAYLETP